MKKKEMIILIVCIFNKKILNIDNYNNALFK